MFIRIRKVDGSTDEFSVTVSNMNSVEVLKDKICRKLWELEGNSIKLFYRGKQVSIPVGSGITARFYYVFVGGWVHIQTLIRLLGHCSFS